MKIDKRLLGDIATRILFAALSAICGAAAWDWVPIGDVGDWDATIGFGIAAALLLVGAVVPRPWAFIDVVTSGIHFWP